MILQRIRIIVGDAGFEPGTSVSEVSEEPLKIIYIIKIVMKRQILTNMQHKYWESLCKN